ncbi:MAG: TlpA family protein disulfide reductase, partial [Pedobacter sp.]
YLQLAENYVNYKLVGTKNKIFVGDYLEFVSKSNQINAKTKEVLLAGSLLTLSSIPDTIYRAFDKFRSEIKDTSLLALLTTRRDYYKRFMDEAKYSNEDISQAKSLQEIFNKFKSKVIYVDFWASWCGPCRQAMPYAAKLKEKLKDKEVVFLYLGFNDQKINWLAARNEIGIEGEHVLLSHLLTDEAADLFKISGIPHYAIIGKDGKIINPKAAGPLEVYEQLLKLAN